MSRELSFLDTCVLIDGLYRDSDHYTEADLLLSLQSSSQKPPKGYLAKPLIPVR
jgi:hypothetical protein